MFRNSKYLNNFILEEKIVCLIELNAHFIAIYSSLLLNDLLNIEIELSNENFESQFSMTLPMKSKLFSLNVLDCK